MSFAGLLGAVTACSSDDSGVQGGQNQDAGGPGTDATSSGGDTGTATDTGTQTDTGAATDSSATTDSGAAPDTSTGDDGGAAGDTGTSDTGAEDGGTPDSGATAFCAGQVGLDFCQDFDEADSLSLDGGAGAWTALVGSPAELALSTAQAASAPDSVLISLPGAAINGDRSAKVVKMISPANGVSQAIYEFDVYIETLPANGAGGFLTDFQFSDTNSGPDRFGFRIGVFSNSAGGFDHADLEHNHPDIDQANDPNTVNPIPITAGAWNHLKMVAAFSADADAGTSSVAFQLFVNRSATATVDATYPSPFAKAAFARLAAGMVFAFDANNKDWGIYYDNFTLKLQ